MTCLPSDPVPYACISYYCWTALLIKYMYCLNQKDSVSGSGTGPLGSESRDPVPYFETQSLEGRYWIPSQPYEDCLGGPVVYSIVSHSRNIWIIFAVFWRNVSFTYHAILYLLF